MKKQSKEVDLIVQNQQIVFLERKWYHGKIIVISFNDNEEQLFQQTVEWLSARLSSTPATIKQQNNGFHIDPFTRTFISDKREDIYLTAKEFDLLYFLFCHKGQVFTKDQLYENVWGFHNAPEGSNLTSFIRKLRKRECPKVCVNPQTDVRYTYTVWRFILWQEKMIAHKKQL